MKTLVVMAAGSSRRFGRWKPVEPVGPNGETLIEYSVNDALCAGFGRVVLVIQPEHESLIRETLCARLKGRVQVAIAYQNPPVNTARRSRPWGTGHAVLCARDRAAGPFGVINSDDFYGPEAFVTLSAFLSRPPTDPPTFGLVGYALADTLPGTGSVSRAICELDDAGRLTGIREVANVMRQGEGASFLNEHGRTQSLDGDLCVSMNMWGFDERAFELLTTEFAAFEREYGRSVDAEFQLPRVVGALLARGRVVVQVLRSTGRWLGLTHPSDVEHVRARLRALHPGPVRAPSTDAEAPTGLKAIVAQYVRGEHLDVTPLGGGHIHRSFRVTGRDADYVLQQVNTHVFAEPDRVAENIARVTTHMSRRLADEGIGDATRRVLCPVETVGGGYLFRDARQRVWRLTRFISNSVTHETIRSPRQAEACAAAYGRFQRLLADWNGPALHQTIPGFHDTPNRFAMLDHAVLADPHGRVPSARKEIDAACARRCLAGVLLDLHWRGEFPERIVHNDAKPANVLFDAHSAEPLCVIDLDTVMPGLSLWDLGDMIRSMASLTAEDEMDLSKVEADPTMVEAVVRGYLREAAAVLTPVERDHLITAGKLMVLEQAVRFLTDYLAGDTYYAVARPDHNLARCRTQFSLLESIERQEETLSCLVRTIC